MDKQQNGMAAAAMASADPSTTGNSRRIALVTGGNKGIGKEIVRLLGRQDDDTNNPTPWTILLGSRDEARGIAAAEELSKSLKLASVGASAAAGTRIVCCPLDLTNPESIQKACEMVKQESKDGKLDVLINNAAICFNDPTLYGTVKHTPFEEQADITVRTNFFGTLQVTSTMLPLLLESPSPRVINIASAAGRLAILRSQALVDTFTDPKLQLSRLEELMHEFVREVEAGTHATKGWPNTCYGMSKLGIIAMTKILARDYPAMMVNSVDPGYCSTDQNNQQGTIPAKRGAVTPVLLATSNDFVSGRHLYQEQEIVW